MELLEKIAVLIDADNTEYGKLEPLLQKIMTRGRIVLKRAYGNWKKEALKNWEQVAKCLAIKLEHQVDYVSGKNVTDIALVIDAMELLHQKTYDCFVIVSSDSDYTPLAIKLKESGIRVIGAGKKQSVESFVQACDEFIVLDNLSTPVIESETETSTVLTEEKNEKKNTPIIPPVPVTNELDELLKTAWKEWQDADGYVNISAAGAYISRVKPDFDIATYGFPKLPKYLESKANLYQTKKYTGKGGVTIIAYKIV